MAKAGRQEQVHDAFGVEEVSAIAAGMSTTANLGAIRVVFETDSQLLADALNFLESRLISFCSCY